jgi:hypothetical protein
MRKAVVCFNPAVRAIQAVVVDDVTGALSHKLAFWRSARHQQTCNHDFKQAAYQTSFQKYSRQCILCVQGLRARG